MSTLRAAFTETMKTAMREKDPATLSAIRMVQAAVKQKDIDVARPRGDQAISDAEILSLLMGMVKQRRESITLYEQGGRADLAAQEAAEIDLIERFLPAPMDDAAVAAAIQGIISETGASSVKDMGKVMTALKERYAGQMDFSKANGLVKTALQG
ncbi:MAG: GatB/YqeY domain-containing protein [Alphaproteobacteria bacterium]|nr:GatB/YqeY domain-containing protein [Alphaproteobacteria bacterium]TAD89365.1 MAG: GatB/YqeY domain-containing protein [Alphaproteobacteria bacterium]